MSRCSRSFLFVALLSLPLAAQGSVSFSFDGAWTASGRTSEANPNSAASYVSLKIDGYPEIRVPIYRGDTPAQIANRCRIWLQNAGFVVVVVSPTVIKVTGRQSGVQIPGRGSIGEDDDNMKGTDLETVKASVAFGGGVGPTPSEEGFGLARPTGFQQSQGGVIRTTLELEGSQTPTVITVNVPPGSYPQQIEMMMVQGFLANGIVPLQWQAPHLFVPAATQPLFGLVRNTMGARVTHVTSEPLIETEIVAMHLQSCMPITVGAIEYGWSWPSSSMRTSSVSNARVGNPLTIDLQTGLPNSFAGLVVGLDDWAMPLPQLLNGTPAPATNGPTLFVQPLGGPVTGFTDAQGEMHHTLVVPGGPAFVGLPLRWQGFDIQAPGPTTVWLSNGLAVQLGA